MRTGLKWFLLSGCTALFGCAADGDSLGQAESPIVLPEPGSLTRFTSEAAGANCAAGGQALEVGLDENRDAELQDEEVLETAYVCNGLAPELELVTIESGDERCLHGGTAVRVSESRGQQEAVACNGAPGAVGAQGLTGATGAEGAQGAQGALGPQGVIGATGAQGPQGADGAQGPQGLQGADGAQGPQGPQGVDGAQGIAGAQGAQGVQGAVGAQGPAAPQPVFGQFFASQIVRGALLTCASVNTAANIATCSGAKLNGLDIRLAGIEANAICNAVTGGSFNSASGSGVAVNPYVIWNGSAWTLASTGASPMANINCNR